MLPGGYYVLVEPTLRCSQIPEMASLVGKRGTTPSTLCEGADNLKVLNAAGQPLKPDYTWGKMLSGYKPGPSQR